MSSRRDIGRGFTLLELIVAMGTTSILLIGATVALNTSISAIDMGDDARGRTLQASDALATMHADIAVATSIASFTPNSIALTVPDRLNAGSTQTVQYTWSGTAGDPIMRAFNGSAGASFLPGVRSVQVGMVDRPAAVAVAGPEQSFVMCDQPAGATVADFVPLDALNWAAQYYRPVLPSGAVSWSISKVRLVLMQTPTPDDTFVVQIRTADSNLRPTGTVLGSATFTNLALPTWAAWTEFPLGPITGLSPTQGVCIVVRGTGASGGGVDMQYVTGSFAQPYNSHFITTSTAGVAWSSPADVADARFEVIGTYSTMVEP